MLRVSVVQKRESESLERLGRIRIESDGTDGIAFSMENERRDVPYELGFGIRPLLRFRVLRKNGFGATIKRIPKIPGQRSLSRNRVLFESGKIGQHCAHAEKSGMVSLFPDLYLPIILCQSYLSPRMAASRMAKNSSTLLKFIICPLRYTEGVWSSHSRIPSAFSDSSFFTYHPSERHFEKVAESTPTPFATSRRSASLVSAFDFFSSNAYMASAYSRYFPSERAQSPPSASPTAF
jgi:hypothetical protein